ncbi:MAG: DMT family transporter [Bacteroidetes bacterium]|nr:MAG: DMT family transporter [Bacteroidota bacterium]
MKKALISLHIAILLAGITAILGKLISLAEGPLVWWRLAIAASVLWLWQMLSPRNALPGRAGFVAKAMAVGGVVGLHWLCFFGSVKYANVSIALVCFSSAGFFSALFEPLVARRKFSLAEVGLGLMSMAGIALIFHFDAQYKTGIILGVASGALAALFSIFNKQLVAHAPGLQLTRYTITGAFLVVSAVLPWYLAVQHQRFWPQPTDWFWLLILALLCTVWAYWLQLKALHYISAFTLNLSYNLEPVYGIVLAFVIFHENNTLHPAFYGGAGLIVLAVVLQMLRVKQQRHQSRTIPTS